MRARALALALVLVACSSDDSTPGPVPGAPTFAGVASVAPVSEDTLRVSWRAGSDAETGAASLRYRVYVSVRGGRAIENPILTTEPNVTSAYVKVAPPGARHFVSVRAIDPEGHDDGNFLEKSAQAAADTTPPTFLGLKSVEGTPDGTVKLAWEAATDDLTSPEGIRYAVFSGPDLVDYTTPLAMVEGVTEVTVPNAIAVGQVKRFAVVSIDAAGNRDDNTIALRHELAAPPTSPVFAGCSAVTALGSKAIKVEWGPAQDDTTPADKIAYDVWLATTPGGEILGGQPTATTIGTASIVIPKLTPNTTYYAICRARDMNGNRDGNSAEKFGKTSDDAAAPTFAGIDTIAFDDTLRTVKLTWLPATDDRTAAGNIVYAVYERRGLAQYDFDKPKLVTAPNALSIELDDLPSNTAFGWVVRARDEALNEDANLQEKNGVTKVSYALDVAPIFVKNCAVVGCHVSALPAGGVSLSSSVAYESIVNVSSNGRSNGVVFPRVKPFEPDSSYLLFKTQVVAKPFSGSPMPAPGTGNTLSDADKATLKSWVEQGAVKN